MIKPILTPTDKSDIVLNTTNNRLIEGISEILPITGNCYDIILVDTETKIVTGDWYYDCESKTVLQCDIDQIKAETCFKVLSTTSKEVDLPLLSNASKLLLINYYNEHSGMPKSVEVIIGDSILMFHIENNEYFYESPTEHGFETIWMGKNYIPLNKQGKVDITIPEVERGITITRTEISKMLGKTIKIIEG